MVCELHCLIYSTVLERSEVTITLTFSACHHSFHVFRRLLSIFQPPFRLLSASYPLTLYSEACPSVWWTKGCPLHTFTLPLTMHRERALASETWRLPLMRAESLVILNVQSGIISVLMPVKSQTSHHSNSNDGCAMSKMTVYGQDWLKCMSLVQVIEVGLVIIFWKTVKYLWQPYKATPMLIWKWT